MKECTNKMVSMKTNRYINRIDKNRIEYVIGMHFQHLLLRPPIFPYFKISILNYIREIRVFFF